MFKLGFVGLCSLTIALAITTPSCTTAQHAYDCNKICNRYKDCFDANYDVGKCASDCRAKADDMAYGDKAVSCEMCIDDRSCAGTFGCAGECVGIVP